MKVKCLLVDDEPLAIKLLQNHLAQLDDFEVVGTCPNPVKAIQILSSAKVDLMFLDIKMPLMSGLDFLKTLKNPPAVIITTAYREYAIEGYDLDLVDYLLKPITFERFFKSVERYLRSKQPVVSQEAHQEFIYVKSGTKVHKIQADKIRYIESIKDYITIHCIDLELKVKHKISQIEAVLNRKLFLRVHRSFIINKAYITSYTGTAIELGKTELPIGSSYKEEVNNKLKS